VASIPVTKPHRDHHRYHQVHLSLRVGNLLIPILRLNISSKVVLQGSSCQLPIVIFPTLKPPATTITRHLHHSKFPNKVATHPTSLSPLTHMAIRKVIFKALLKATHKAVHQAICRAIHKGSIHKAIHRTTHKINSNRHKLRTQLIRHLHIPLLLNNNATILASSRILILITHPIPR